MPLDLLFWFSVKNMPTYSVFASESPKVRRWRVERGNLLIVGVIMKETFGWLRINSATAAIQP